MDKMEENGAEFSQMSDDCCTDRNKQTCENEMIQVQVKPFISRSLLFSSFIRKNSEKWFLPSISYALTQTS
jgi:hypothetical protein